MVVVVLVLKGLYDALKDWVCKLWNILTSLFWWVYDLVLSVAFAAYRALLAQMPEGVQEIAPSVESGLALADYWTGFGGVVLIVLTYWGFALSFAVFKFAVKLIPTVG